MRLSRTLPLVAMISLATMATACGSDGGVTATTSRPNTTDGSTPDTTPAGSIELPTNPNAAVVIGPDNGYPAITADGRVFDRVPSATAGFRSTDGASPAMVPAPPAPSAVQTARLTPDGLARLMAEANQLGLLQDPPDYGEPGITDQGSSSMSLTTAAGTFEHWMYAPGEATGDAAADAARERFDEFADSLFDLRESVGDELSAWTPFVPHLWRVDLDAYVVGDDVQDWPLTDLPADGCTTFAVRTEGTPSDSVSGAYEATVDGETVTFTISPVLPFETC